MKVLIKQRIEPEAYFGSIYRMLVVDEAGKKRYVCHLIDDASLKEAFLVLYERCVLSGIIPTREYVSSSVLQIDTLESLMEADCD